MISRLFHGEKSTQPTRHAVTALLLAKSTGCCAVALQLASEAQAAVAQLTGALKPPGVFSMPGTVAVVAFRAAAAIATQRPTQLGRVLPTLLSVAHAAGKLGEEQPWQPRLQLLVCCW